MQYSAIALLIILALSTISFFPNVAADEWKIYELSHSGQVFKIPYKIINGEIKKIEQDPDFPSMLVFIAIDPSHNETLEITIPRELVHSVPEGSPIILVDGDEVEYKEMLTPCFRTISIPLLVGSKALEVVGTVDPRSTLSDRPPPPPAVYIATDKNSYALGEVITVSGCTSLALDDEEVIVEVLNPQGKIYEITSITPNIDGSFATSLSVGGELAINGTYTARATYAGKSSTSSFVVPEFPVFGLSIFASAIALIMATRLMPKLNSEIN